ncbi:hypothetical protein BIW11_00945 [Tropilaelaps mercedesae]|uniref:Protein with SprT-like domain at the N terminus n=1 Tax=Tropilaelaps mercedesae TaxID=418985 RepID=A0A1V9XM25_9ACAR|nr:hypothetical protein BIW11_00945 [Tropilaelaps mercedesae]
MDDQEAKDRQLAEALQREEYDGANGREEVPSRRFETSIYDLEEDRKLAERLQQEEENEYLALKNEKPQGPRNPEVGAKFRSLLQKHHGLSVVDPSWETIDPTPDIFAMFQAFDDMFFQSALRFCTVSWSPRMTSCAGLCCFQGNSCSIRLSKPLLTLRPRADLVETLLHEMIHAYVFIIGKSRSEGRDGHGPEFHKHMRRINAEARCNITVYHTFHDEVRFYKVHHWRCDGPCRNRHPFYGWVKRSRNCAPSKNDRWWADHQRSCGGTFIKVSEPEKKERDKTQSRKRTRPSNVGPDDRMGPLSKLFKKMTATQGSAGGQGTPSKPTPTQRNSPGGSSSIAGFSGFASGSHSSPVSSISRPVTSTVPARFVPFQGIGHKLGAETSSTTGLIRPGLPKISSVASPVGNRLRQTTLDGVTARRSTSSRSTEKAKKPSPADILRGRRLIEEVFSSDDEPADNANGDRSIGKPEAQRHSEPVETLRSGASQAESSREASRPSDATRAMDDDSVVVKCPVCSNSVPERNINPHLDRCLGL